MTESIVNSIIKEDNELHQIDNLSVSVHSSFNDLEGHREEWDRFSESVKGDIYLTYDWCRIWWEHYGNNRELRIFVFRVKGDLVGVVPMFVETIWLGPVWMRVAKVVGCDHTMIMTNPPVQSDFASTIFAQVLTDLAAQCECDSICIGPVSGQYTAIEDLRNAGRSSDHVIPFRDSVRSPYTVFHLPESFDAYVDSLDKRQRGNLKRDMNLLKKSFVMSEDIITNGDQVEGEFERFIQMHNEQWAREGKLGHFKDWPGGTQFNTAIVHEMAKRGRLRLLRLIVDGQVVSYQLCFAFRDCWCWRLPARLVGSQWDRFALGRIGLIKEIEAAIAQGVREIEAGAGHYDYKVKLGGEEYKLYSIMYVRNRWSSRYRTILFSMLSKWLHFCYYRVWFNKLAPKLPFQRRPLWKIWIRSRL